MKLTRHAFLAALAAVGAGCRSTVAPPCAAQDAAQPTGECSFAQSGEDLIASTLLGVVGTPKITYLDIGAHDPVVINNTYYFYRRGARGVLVEPNVDMCKKLRAVRPEDTTLEAGIGISAVREADYYLMTDSAWNTFSKEEADHMTRVTGGSIKIERVVKMPLLEINEVMAKHFGGAPAYLSIDAEGLHLAILKTVDFKRFRPAVICVETLVAGTRQMIPEIPAFMETQQYVARGSTFVNTIFVDGHRI
jgi:FkbM family methyltransferase